MSMNPDPRLRNPEFNPIDDPAMAIPGASVAEAWKHRYVTLYDRLLIAALASCASNSDYLVENAHEIAIAALEQRAKAFGVEANRGS